MISIIIPIYNDERFIELCLKSIQNQTFEDFECLCIDDGSTDKTIQIIEDFIKTDLRFKLYKNFHKGPGWERNFGIREAKGEFITFMDHDDWVEPTWLEKLYNTLIHNKVDISYCSNADYFNDENRYENYYFTKKELRLNKLNYLHKGKCLTNKYFAPWRRLVRKQLIIENHIQFAEGKFKFDDVLFTQELIEHVKSVAFCNEVLYYHRIFESSITGNGMKNHDMFFEHLDTAEEVIKYAKTYNKSVPLMVSRMIPLLITYFKYVESTEDYYKRFYSICRKAELNEFVLIRIWIIKNTIYLKRFVKKVLKVNK